MLGIHCDLQGKNHGLSKLKKKLLSVLNFVSAKKGTNNSVYLRCFLAHKMNKPRSILVLFPILRGQVREQIATRGVTPRGWRGL